jgi:hypothetical protein
MEKMTIRREENYFELICDECGTLLGEYKTFRDAVAAKKELGMKSIRVNGEWIDLCEDCQ